MKIRKAYSLISYWEGESFCIVNYLTNRKISTNILLITIIDFAKEALTLQQLQQKFNNIPDISQIIESLLKHSILIKEGSLLDKKDKKLHTTWKWGIDAQYFHFATKDVSYTFNFPEIRKAFEEKSLSDPPPSPFKTSNESDKIPLQKGRFPKIDFWEVLYQRRTCRDFKMKPISKSVFSSFLFSVAGMTQYYNSSILDKRIIKTSPSGGARHPVEVYPVIQNVTGIPNGVYHYEVESNSLALINSFPGQNVMAKLFSGQYWVKESAVMFFFTAVLPRSMWKYDHSRAYRVTLLDTGHIGQTFHLAGTAFDLGVFTTAALQDKLIEKVLKVDGISEIVLYAGAIGHPKSI